MRRLAVLLALTAPAAMHGQGLFVLAPAPPGTVRALVGALQRVGWLPAGGPSTSVRCPEYGEDEGEGVRVAVLPMRTRPATAETAAGPPLCTRADVLRRAGYAVLERRPWPARADEYDLTPFVPRTDADRALGHRLVDTLAHSEAFPAQLADTLARAYADPQVWAERPFASNTPHQRLLDLAAALVEDAERLHPDVLEPAAARLERFGLLAPARAARMRADARAGRFRPATTVSYLDRAVPVGRPIPVSDRTARGRIAARMVEIAGRLQAAGVAALPFDTASVAVNPNPGTPGYRERCLRFQGRFYPIRWLPQRAGEGRTFRTDYSGLFNLLLRDVGSPYRLVGVGSEEAGSGGWLVALTRAEAEAIEAPDWELIAYDRRPGAFGLSYPFYADVHVREAFETPPVDSLEAAFDRMAAAGLFWNESSAHRAQERARLIEYRGRLSGVRYRGLRPGPRTTLSDADPAFVTERPYAQAVRLAAEMSRGAFRPDRIRDNSRRGRATGQVTFATGGREWRIPFRRGRSDARDVHGNRFADVDRDALRAIFRAANETVTGGRFLRLRSPHDLDEYHFLTPPQRAVLEALGEQFEDP